jgi:hypothetical protein
MGAHNLVGPSIGLGRRSTCRVKSWLVSGPIRLEHSQNQPYTTPFMTGSGGVACLIPAFSL